jgi:hypothetical protein
MESNDEGMQLEANPQGKLAALLKKYETVED